MSEHQKLQEALDACARMQDQRDQLAAQLKDATALRIEMLDVLKAVFEEKYGYGVAPTFDELDAIIAKAEGK